MFSQYGEILDLNMVRDRETGKPQGFCFLKYDDQRSTVLAVDNFNGVKLLGRTLRVDHSREYRQKSKRKRRRSDESESEESEVELDEEGKPRVKGFNVAPKGWLDPLIEEEVEPEDDLGEGIDPDDPMRDYLIEQRREERDGKNHRKEKIKQEEDNDRERRHRHRSKKDEEERHKHHHRHHRHRHRHRIEDGKGNRDEDRNERPENRHRRQDPDTHRRRNRQADFESPGTPDRSRRDRDETPETRRYDRDDTPDGQKARESHRQQSTP